MKTILIGLAVIAAAVFVSWFGWWSAASPAALHRVPLALVRAINLPVAVAGWIAQLYQGIDLWFHSPGCDFCTFVEHRWNYFKFAVPVYAFLFSLPLFVVAWLKRRAA